MFNRTSKNANNHRESSYPYNEYSKLTKYEKLKMYDELAAKVADKLLKTPAEQYSAMRAILKFVHFYPVVQGLKPDFFSDYPSRYEFIRSLVNNARATVYYSKRETLLDDVAHIEKIMTRYQLDFDKAFDFFVLNNALRTDFQYRGKTGKKIYQVADEMLYSKFLETAAKVCLSEQQLQAIIPALMSKMACSENKMLFSKHEKALLGKDNNTGQFFKTATAYTKEVDACVKKYESRSLNFTK